MLGRGTYVSQGEDIGQSPVQEGPPRTPRGSEQCYRPGGEPGGQTGHKNAVRTPVLFHLQIGVRWKKAISVGEDYETMGSYPGQT